MIDKISQEWKSVPFWVKLMMLGMRTRKEALQLEYTFLFMSIVTLIISLFGYVFYVGYGVTALFFVYYIAITIRWIDNANLWGEDEKQ